MVENESIEEERDILRRRREEAAKSRADRAASRSRRFIPAMATTKKKLSKWSTRGLDISEAGFSKLHAKESKYEDDKEKIQPRAGEVQKIR